MWILNTPWRIYGSVFRDLDLCVYRALRLSMDSQGYELNLIQPIHRRKMSHMRLRTCLGLFDLPRPKDNAVSRHQTIGQLSSAAFQEVI